MTQRLARCSTVLDLKSRGCGFAWPSKYFWHNCSPWARTRCCRKWKQMTPMGLGAWPSVLRSCPDTAVLLCLIQQHGSVFGKEGELFYNLKLHLRYCGGFTAMVCSEAQKQKGVRKPSFLCIYILIALGRVERNLFSKGKRFREKYH